MTGCPARTRCGTFRDAPIFARSLRADPLDVRATLNAMARCLARAAPDDLVGRAELVLAEIMNNVGEHGLRPQAGGRPVIHLRIDCAAGGLCVGLSDNGAELPGSCLDIRDPPGFEPFLPEGGFGWFLIRDLTDSLCYIREGRRNYLSFTIQEGLS